LVPILYHLDSRARSAGYRPNDLRFTKVTIAAMVGHSERSVIRKYVRALDAYINRLPNQREFKQSAYALDRDSHKAALARFLCKAEGTESEGADDQREAA
jgi:hypothetical protein